MLNSYIVISKTSRIVSLIYLTVLFLMEIMFKIICNSELRYDLLFISFGFVVMPLIVYIVTYFIKLQEIKEANKHKKRRTAKKWLIDYSKNLIFVLIYGVLSIELLIILFLLDPITLG